MAENIVITDTNNQQISFSFDADADIRSFIDTGPQFRTIHIKGPFTFSKASLLERQKCLEVLCIEDYTNFIILNNTTNILLNMIANSRIQKRLEIKGKIDVFFAQRLVAAFETASCSLEVTLINVDAGILYFITCIQKLKRLSAILSPKIILSEDATREINSKIYHNINLISAEINNVMHRGYNTIKNSQEHDQDSDNVRPPEMVTPFRSESPPHPDVMSIERPRKRCREDADVIQRSCKPKFDIDISMEMKAN